MSLFSNVPQCEPNTASKISSGFRIDERPNKINLAIGAYRNDDGNKELCLQIIIYESLDENEFKSILYRFKKSQI